MNRAISPSKFGAGNTLVRLARFWHWWLEAISSLLPTNFRQWASGSDFRFYVRIDGDRIEILEAGNLQAKVAEQIELNDLEACGIKLRKKCAEAGISLKSLAVLLDSRSVLTRSVILPLAAERGLTQVVGFELDRLTPFRRDQSYFDHRLLARNTSAGTLSVEIDVIRRESIDGVLRQMRELGIQVTGLAHATDGGREARPLSISELGFGQRDRSARRTMRAAWFAFTILFLATALLIPVAQKHKQLVELNERLAIERNAALKVSEQREQLEGKVGRIGALPLRKWSEPSALKVLDELSRLLPTDTFASTFEFDGKTVQLQGESGSSTGLIEMLEASPMFEQVAFKAPLVKIPQQTGDRFHIVFYLDKPARHSPEELVNPHADKAPGNAG